MSEHGHKLKCVPLSLTLAAAAKGKTLDPDEIWRRFSVELSLSKNDPGAGWVSLVLDMARSFDLCRHLDVTHDLEAAQKSLTHPAVFCVLMFWERVRLPTTPEELSVRPHVVLVRHIEVGCPDKSVLGHVHVRDMQPGGEPFEYSIPASELGPMRAFFVVLFSEK